MKKKVFFGLLGLGVLLCSSLVAFAQTSGQEAKQANAAAEVHEIGRLRVNTVHTTADELYLTADNLFEFNSEWKPVWPVSGSGDYAAYLTGSIKKNGTEIANATTYLRYATASVGMHLRKGDATFVDGDIVTIWGVFQNGDYINVKESLFIRDSNETCGWRDATEINVNLGNSHVVSINDQRTAGEPYVMFAFNCPELEVIPMAVNDSWAANIKGRNGYYVEHSNHTTEARKQLVFLRPAADRFNLMIYQSSWLNNYTVTVTGDKIITDGYIFSGEYLIQFDFVLDVRGTSDIVAIASQNDNVAFDYSNVTLTSYVGDANAKSFIFSLANESSHIVVDKGWGATHNAGFDFYSARIYPNSGNEYVERYVALVIEYVNESDPSQGVRYRVLFTTYITDAQSNNNYYNFVAGDRLVINGTATHIYGNWNVHFNYDLDIRFKSNTACFLVNPAVGSVDLDYRSEQVTAFSNAHRDSEEDIYVTFGDGYLAEDNLPVQWVFYHGISDVTYTHVGGAVETKSSAFAKEHHQEGKEEYCFAFWGTFTGENAFKTGDRLDFDTFVIAEYNGGAYNIRFSFSLWYIAELKTVAGYDGSWVDETTYAPIQDTIDAIDAIGAVTPEKGELISDARDLYDALTARQKYLVLNYSDLQDAETAFAGFSIGTVHVDLRNSGWAGAAANYAILFMDKTAEPQLNGWSTYVTGVASGEHLVDIPYALEFEPKEMTVVRYNPSYTKSDWDSNKWPELWGQTPDITFGEMVRISDVTVAGKNEAYLGYVRVQGGSGEWTTLATLDSVKSNGSHNVEYYSSAVTLTAGQEFKILVAPYASGDYYGNYTVHSTIASNFSGGNGNNISVLVGGTYAFYFDSITNNVHITKVEIAEADEWAEFFLANVGCDASGVNLPTGWTVCATRYGELSGAAKNVIYGANANESGSYIEQAVARYDHAVSSHPSLAKFIVNSTDTVRAVIDINVYSSLNTDATLIIVVASTIGLLSIGGYFFLRKRHQ